jgi:hypothetical protein
MRWIYIFAVLAIGSLPAKAAQTETCKAQADDKKLSGAALKSFMNNCKRDAKATCDETADEKSLSGTARARFAKKCIIDAVGK